MVIAAVLLNFLRPAIVPNWPLLPRVFALVATCGLLDFKAKCFRFEAESPSRK